MTKIHIFNPDTDYALASGLNFYTPPARIIQLRREMALFPLTFADPGDAVLCLDPMTLPELEQLDGYETALREGTRIYLPVTRTDNCGRSVTVYADPRTGLTPDADAVIAPWGWNPALRRHLADAGFDAAALPSAGRVADLRALSHRRTTVEFNTLLSSFGLTPDRGYDCVVPREMHDVGSVMEFVRLNPDSYLKAPWSSSGRGVIRTDDLEERHIHPWACGILRRQGAVMCEPAAQRALDFATEWICREGRAHFFGLSVFDTSRRGKYLGNRHGDTAMLEHIIAEAAPGWGDHLIEAQRRALDTIVSPRYEGPLGIDMLADTSGRIRPCIEINLRMTMGMATLMRRDPDGPDGRTIPKRVSAHDTDAGPEAP